MVRPVAVRLAEVPTLQGAGLMTRAAECSPEEARRFRGRAERLRVASCH
jgi:hypothetical protein